METIHQQSSRMLSERNLKDSESPSFELLFRAHDRIRALESQNEELINQLYRRDRQTEQVALLQKQLVKLGSIIREKDIEIQNLQRINENAILDYLLLQKRMQLAQEESWNWQNAVPIPSELNLPLSLSRINRKHRELQEEQERAESRGGARQEDNGCAKINAVEKDRTQMERVVDLYLRQGKQAQGLQISKSAQEQELLNRQEKFLISQIKKPSNIQRDD